MLFLWALLLLLPPPSSAAGKSEVFFAQVGGSVTLPYEGHTEKESVYVRWYFCSNEQEDLLIWKHPKQDSPKNEAPKEFKDRVFLSKDSSLNITPLQETDFAKSGFFKCVQQDYKSKNEKEYRLYRVHMPTALTLLAGDDLSLSCQTDAGVTPPSIRWISPRSETYSTQPKNSLRVTDVSFQHSGVWTCEAESDPPKLKATTAVTVIDLSPSPPSVYTSLSSGSLWLPCSLSSAISWSTAQEKGLRTGSWSFTPLNPTQPPKQQLLLQFQPSAAWKKTNDSDTQKKPLLEERELKNHDLSVKIPKVSPKIRGTYKCSLEFSSGRTLSRTLQLEVLEVLSSPSAAPQGVMARSGDTVNLTCTLGHSLPSGDLQVTWIRPQSSVFSLGDPPHPAHLSIPAVTVQDSGQWKCELKKNTTTLTSATVTLDIKKRVDIWVFVAIGSALVFILLLAITVFFLRRHKQAKMFRRRKTKFCCCKNPQPKGFYKT